MATVTLKGAVAAHAIKLGVGKTLTQLPPTVEVDDKDPHLELVKLAVSEATAKARESKRKKYLDYNATKEQITSQAKQIDDLKSMLADLHDRLTNRRGASVPARDVSEAQGNGQTAPDTEGLKVCPRCHVAKSIDRFGWRRSSGRDGHQILQAWCRECRNYAATESRNQHDLVGSLWLIRSTKPEYPDRIMEVTDVTAGIVLGRTIGSTSKDARILVDHLTTRKTTYVLLRAQGNGRIAVRDPGVLSGQALPSSSQAPVDDWADR